jgi:hypothetical protein
MINAECAIRFWTIVSSVVLRREVEERSWKLRGRKIDRAGRIYLSPAALTNRKADKIISHFTINDVSQASAQSWPSLDSTVYSWYAHTSSIANQKAVGREVMSAMAEPVNRACQ